jgi:hypothetical protein
MTAVLMGRFITSAFAVIDLCSIREGGRGSSTKHSFNRNNCHQKGWGQSDSYQNMSIEVSKLGVTITTSDLVHRLRIGANPLRQTQCSGMASSTEVACTHLGPVYVTDYVGDYMYQINVLRNRTSCICVVVLNTNQELGDIFVHI